MAKLHTELFGICDRNRDGSHATQANRRAILRQFVDDLARAGFNVRAMSSSDLKGRHVNALLKGWKAKGISIATIKNRMAVLRWWAEKIGNKGAVKTNAELGIGLRNYTTNEDKSASLSSVDLSKLDSYIHASLCLQETFGLRREEAMKFQPIFALSGQRISDASFISLKPSWTKGGRARQIPITSEAQRAALAFAMSLAGAAGESLIPANRSYRQHLSIWEQQTASVGIGNTHGLRHAYAQRRYKELTGFNPPSIEGIRDLSAEEKLKDLDAREKISAEMGHGRISVTSIYLGSWKKKGG